MSTPKQSSREQTRLVSAEERAESGLTSTIQEEEVTTNIEEKLPLRQNSQASSSIQISSTHEDKGTKIINIGEYEISFPEEKLPLLGVMAFAILLHVSIFIEDSIYSSKYRYGIFLSMFAFFGALVSTALPTKRTTAINYCIFISTLAGACMSTNEALSTLKAGPFVQPGNGYFSVCGLAICSGIAADPPGSLKRANFNSLLNLGAAALVVVLSLLPHIVQGSDFDVEVYICLSVAGVTIIIASLMCVLKLCTWKSNQGNGGGQAVLSTIMACLWLGKWRLYFLCDEHTFCSNSKVTILHTNTGSACVVTFRGPFKNVGNGYFASWFAAVMSVKVATLEWRTRMLKNKSEI